MHTHPGPTVVSPLANVRCVQDRSDQRNWPAEVSGSLSHATTTTSPGSITAHPVSRSSRTKPSGRTLTPVSFLVPVVLTPTWPTLLTIIAIEPDLPMSG